jgi:predicted RND superfamily exporter protein
MADEEFASITDRGELLAGLMLGATLLMLWLALRSVRMIVAILATIAIGLCLTTAIGLLIYGQFNVISVAFIVLFVGLGVDFGIQFCVRYRAERHRLGSLRDALAHAGTCTGTGLTLAAVAAALAFYSFLPTKYAGLAELGLIAGTGMVITYILSITLLPALLTLLQPSQEAEEIGFRELAPVDRFLTQNCRRVLIGALIVGLFGAALTPFLHFDSNPLDLRNPKSESVATARDKTRAAPHALALARTLDRLAQANPDVRAHATQAFVPGLKTMLGELRAALHPQPIRFERLPKDLLRDWISADGQYRVQVFPAAQDNKSLRYFTRAVLAVAPDATGTPIIIMESARTIVWAFVEAGVLSFVSIAVILVLALRRFGDELMTLVPLLLAGVLTLASCVVFGIQLNFANIIALPLLFGVGVAFDIYFVMWWREGGRNLLQSPLTRAVLMSAGTTGAAFGTLSLSSHPGTASMGELLLISLFWILVSMLVVLPALLHHVLPEEGLEPAE